MEVASHLERMGKELKCPICLSLLNSAVSLTCNHVFCNLCIDKSMRSDSTCPVCKIPYRKREVRPAPHMDTLVSIYKNMEASSAMNSLVMQTALPSKLSDRDNQVENEIPKSKTTSKACRDTPNPHNQIRYKGKTLKGSLKKPKGRNSNHMRPSFPTKKRIQVPQHPVQETPTRPANHEGGKSELIKNGNQQNVSASEHRFPSHEKGDTLFSPFFWLRDEEDAEKTTQLTDGGATVFSTPDAPCFSDIKDSDDDKPCNMTSKDADIYDSEMFEWTQRPCSPELCSSPMKMQQKETDGYNRVQEIEHKGDSRHSTIHAIPGSENEVCMTPQKETNNMEMILPSLSSPQIENANHEAEIKRSKKRGKKAKEDFQKKKLKRSTNDVIGVCGVSLKGADQDISCTTGGLMTLKEKQIHKRGKKVYVDSKYMEALITEDDTIRDGGKTLNYNDNSTCGSPNSFNPRENHDKSHNSNCLGKNNEKTINRQHTDRSIRLKPQNMSNIKNKIAENNKAFISKSHGESSCVDGEMKATTSRRKTKKNQVSKNIKSLKRVTFSRNGTVSVKSADGIQSSSENAVVKDPQLLREGHHSSNVRFQKDSHPPAKSNAMVLRKCDTVPDIHCAFCQSAEESSLSGPIVHYLKGKLVTADQEGGSSAIHAHRNCTEWAPNVYFEDDTALNLEAELARSRRIKCCCCGIKGAALGCYEKSCRRSFHFLCAKLTPQCRWDDDNFVMLCPLHASHKLPNEAGGSQLERKKKGVAKRQSNIKPSQVAVSDTVTPSRWDSHELFKKIVICCSALTSMEKEVIVKFERLSGVRVQKTWDSKVTHVIASTDDNGACKRTLKYLMGILEGKWILTMEWIKACMEVKKPVEEQLYEINVDIHGLRDGPRLGRFRLLNKQPKLFSGYKFFFSGDFVASYKGYLHDLIISGGGIVLHRKPIAIDHQPTNSLTFIIYSLELPENCKIHKKNILLSCRKSDAEALATSTGAVAVSNSWILNSIAASKLQNID